MKLLILIFSIFFMLNSCSKTKECCTIVDLAFYVNVSAANGDDLLNPSNPQAIKFEDINLYYKKGQDYVKVSDSRLDDPKNIHLIKEESGRYKLRIYINREVNESKISTTLIQFGNRNPDKIEAEIIKNRTSTYLGKVWVNEQPVDKGKVYEFVK